MIRTADHGAVRVVIVDRPEVHNALDAQSLAALDAAVSAAAADEAIAAIVFSGAGGRAFAAGGDIAELSRPMSGLDALRLPMQRVFTAIADCPKPTIAAVDGYALGGGFELALACDIRVAGLDAQFGLPELRWSVLPAAGGISRLTRLVGPGRALDAVLTARRFGAQEALAYGIVTETAPAGEALVAALAVADRIGRMGPAAVAIARRAVRLAAESSLEASLSAEMLGLAVLYETQDKAEGTRSFVEKREPRYTGR